MEPQQKLRGDWKTWSPNQLEKNSNPQGLLRADNLTFRKTGGVSRCQNPSRISSGAFTNTPNSLYSITVPGSLVGIANPYAKLRYAAYNGTVLRNFSGGSPTEVDFSGSVLTGGASGYAAFGTAWGNNIICSGSEKRADSGPVDSWRDISLGALGAPGVAKVAKEEIILSDITGFGESNYVGVEFEDLEFSANADYVYMMTMQGPFRAIAQVPDNGSNQTADWSDFTRGVSPNDLFSMNIRIGDTSKIDKVRIEVLLETPQTVGTSPDIQNYFWFDWINGQAVETNPDTLNPDIYGYTDREQFIKDVQANITPGVSFSNFFREGSNAWGVIECLRGQFKRVGSDSDKDWNTVKGFRVILIATEQTTIYFATPKFISGAGACLNQGYFKYLQVPVRVDGDSVQVGIAGTPSEEILLIREPTTITPTAPSGSATHTWIFRSSTQTPGYFRIKSVTDDTPFIDEMSDLDALKEIPLEPYRTDLPDDIRFIVGPIYDRVLYFSPDTIYPSFQYDFGSYDGRFPSKIASLNGETILWVRIVSDYYIFVGTTKDIYVIRGDFSYDEMLQILNFEVKGIGTDQPPINSSCAVFGTSLIYQAEDGWRILEGTSSRLLAEMPLLYYGEDCHGIEKLNDSHRNNSTVSCIVSHNRFIVSAQHGSQGRKLQIFDFSNNSWEFRSFPSTIEPLHLYVEPDGTVIFTTTETGDKYLYALDGGYGTVLPVIFRTIIDHLDFLGQRKDFATLKLSGNFQYTGTPTIKFTMSEGVNAQSYDASFNLSATTKTTCYNLNGLTEPMKNAQLEISGDFTQFDLHYFEVDFTPRPVQRTTLYIPESAMGKYGLKHISALPFVIDTLGLTVECIPILDGVSQTAYSFSCGNPQLLAYQFTSAKSSELIGYLFRCASGVFNHGFEFYDVLQPVLYQIAPERVKYTKMFNMLGGTFRRKKISSLPIIINTFGNNVTLTLTARTKTYDGLELNSLVGNFTINTTGKSPYIAYFDEEVICTDLDGILDGGSNLFENYGVNEAELSYEILPPSHTFMVLPSTNFNTQKVKRFNTIAMKINTKGVNVTLTPKFDNVATTPITINTSYPKTVIYQLTAPIEATDVDGTLDGTKEFEWYGWMIEESVFEALPPLVKYYDTGMLNFGSPNKKRLRAWPFQINTKGQNVQVKGYNGTNLHGTSTYNTSELLTKIFWFDEDVFDIDYKLEFGGPFSGEFRLGKIHDPEIVDVLPVGKLFDQVGPIDELRGIELVMLRVQMYATGVLVPYTVYSDDTVVVTGNITTVANKLRPYELKLTMGVNVRTVRIEFGPTNEEFHRTKLEMKILGPQGAETDNQWVKL